MKNKTKKPEPSALKRAVCAVRGGHENTSEEGIKRLFDSLDPNTQLEIMEDVAGTPLEIACEPSEGSGDKLPQDEAEGDDAAKGGV